MPEATLPGARGELIEVSGTWRRWSSPSASARSCSASCRGGRALRGVAPRIRDPRGAGLLAGTGVSVQRPRLDCLVDLRDERAVFACDAFRVAPGDCGLEPAV